MNILGDYYMRKTMKKIVSVLLSVLLLAAPLTTSFAAAEEATFKMTFIYTDASGQPHTSSKIIAAGSPVEGEHYVPAPGQEFSGWFEDANLTQPAPATMPDHDLTLYAAMKWIDYTVTYTLHGQTIDPQTYHYGDTISLPAIDVPKGYTFSGWSDLQGNPYTENSIITDNVDLYGVITQNEYDLVYYVNGAVFRTEENKHFDDALSYYEYSADTGWTFSGWFADEACTVPAPANMPDSDLAVYGKYTQNRYAITYYVDGVDSGNKQTDYLYGQTIQPHEAAVKEGYTFSGWFLDANLTQRIPDEMPDHDLTFYGRYAVNQYTVTYFLNGEYYTTQTYDFGAAIQYLDYAAQEGYSFSGWRLANGDRKPLTMPAYNVEVYATLTKMAVAALDGGSYENITVGDTVDVTVTLDAPFLTSLTVSDIIFDSDVFMLDSMQWLIEGDASVDLGNRLASIRFDENTDLDGEILLLTFVVLSNAEVGNQEIGFAAAATTDMGIGSVDVTTKVTNAKVQVICAQHNFVGGEVIANKNNTHSLFCANGCGVSVNQSCSGGTATCLQKAVCSICKAEYGQKLRHSYADSPKGDGNGFHSYRCVNGCGAYSTQKIACTYGVAFNNGDNASHSITCTVCGTSKDENCYGGTVTCIAVAVCERCNVEYGTVLAHEYTGAIRNNYDGTHERLCVNGCDLYGGLTDCSYSYENKKDGVHTKTCAECGYTVDEYCVGGKATCLASAVCSYCETAYGEKIAHSYTGEARDNKDGTHSFICVSGCEAYGEALACTAGEYQPDGDGTHSTQCTACASAMVGNCSGGTATCEKYAVCDVCGGDHGELLAHDYNGEYAPNEDGTHSKTCLNGCNKPGGEKIACTYGEWVGDGIRAHSKTCSVCGDMVTEDCSGGEASCTQKAKCAVCKSVYGELLAHTFPAGEQGLAVSKNDGTHTRYCTSCEQDVILACEYVCIPNNNATHVATCSLCAYTETAQACFGGNVTCLAAAVCEGCGVSYGDPLDHDYSGEAKANGNGTHCLQCVNGCEKFGGEKIDCTPGTYTSNGDDTHSATCVVCNGVLTSKCSGGTASCEKQAICEVCNTGYGKGGDHNFTSAHDDTHHWGACTGCEKTTPKDEHRFTPWTILEEETPEHTGLRRRLCLDCGAVFVEIIPHLYPKGDVDFDGVITATDARLALRASVSLETLSAAATAAADVEKDGVITAGDARLLLRASVGLEDASLWGDIGLDDEGNPVE